MVHAHVDPLALAGEVAVAQGSADGEHGGPGGDEVDEGCSGLGGGAVDVAGDPTEAVGALLGGGLGWVAGIGPVAVAVAGVGGHDYVGAHLA